MNEIITSGEVYQMLDSIDCARNLKTIRLRTRKEVVRQLIVRGILTDVTMYEMVEEDYQKVQLTNGSFGWQKIT